VEMWSFIEERSGRLSPRERLVVRDAIANGVLEGYRPTPDAIECLIAFAAGDLTFGQYKQRALASIDLHREIHRTKLN
jgi:Antitoxin VbhA